MFAADQERWSTQSSPRSGPIVRFVWHHQAGANDDGTIGAMVSGSRQVSSTWTVDNKAPVGAGLRDYARITAVVPEDRRPWTSASRADDGALTVECANSSGPPDYGISEASHRACARLAAYALRAYGVPLQRATAANGWRGHMGHNEVVGAFGDGYATACPLHLDIDYILELAGGGGVDGGALQPTTPEEDMTPDQANQLSNLYAAMFVGGPDMPGGRSVVDILRNIDAVLIAGGPDMPGGSLSTQVAQIREAIEHGDFGSMVSSLSDADAAKLAKAVNDDAARRLQS